MVGEERYINERLDHLGIGAGVCQEIGLAAWRDAQDPGKRPQVSLGTATVAMMLNGVGWSLRQLYLVPQFFANKPIEHWASVRNDCRDARASTAWDAHSHGMRNEIEGSTSGREKRGFLGELFDSL